MAFQSKSIEVLFQEIRTKSTSSPQALDKALEKLKDDMISTLQDILLLTDDDWEEMEDVISGDIRSLIHAAVSQELIEKV